MANLPLAFAELLAGGILMTAGIKDPSGSVANVVKGIDSGKGLAAFDTGSSSPSSPTSTGSGGAVKDTTAPGVVGQVTMNDLEQIGAKHGWTGQQLQDWMNVIQQESGGNPNVVNATSGASGIAQFINGFGEYAQYGGSASSVTGQLTAMANYIAERYGTPSAAWAHETSENWY